MSKIKVLPRIFKYDNITLEDIDPSATPDEIMESYAEIYPDLTNAVVEGPEMTEDAIVYTFKTKVGTKGNNINLRLMENIDNVLQEEERDDNAEKIRIPSEILNPIA